MRQLTQLENRVLELLRFGRKRGSAIGRELGIPAKEAGRVISQIRKKFLDGDANASYIFTTKNGYTLEETPDNLQHEGLMRLRMGTSVILNGRHVYNRCKMIDLSRYNSIRLEFYPKAETIVKALTKEVVSVPERR